MKRTNESRGTNSPGDVRPHFRSKLGLDIAIEALREVWRSRKASVDELIKAAEVNRVFRIMRPYIEATV